MCKIIYRRRKINLLGFALAMFAGLFSINSMAQSIEITPSYGVHFGTRLNYGPNYLKIKGSDQYGITIGVETIEDVMVEASYFHQGTELRIREVFYGPSENRLSDLAMDWIMVGGTRYIPSGNIRPFIGGSLGMVIFSPSNENRDIINRSLSSQTKFAFAFKGGVNIMFSERIGLNLQGNLFLPVDWGGLYVSGGSGGVSGGVGVSSTTLIGGFSSGLVFKLK